jgi:hypothetical protein
MRRGAPLDPKKTKQFYATLHFSQYITEGSTAPVEL